MMIMTAAKTMTTATLADALDTDPRTLRKFLRSSASPVPSVGKGSRYSLPATKAALTDFGKKFAAWEKAQSEAKAKRDAAAADAPIEAPAADTDPFEPEAITDTADDDPTDAELDAIELDEN
jgi:hypothetical protein